MSFSNCFNCHNMVASYEKYCPKCAKTHRQDDTFWKDEPDANTIYCLPSMRERELKKDALPVSPKAE
jgi:predicted amidophosphoribosyltransferase